MEPEIPNGVSGIIVSDRIHEKDLKAPESSICKTHRRWWAVLAGLLWLSFGAVHTPLHDALAEQREGDEGAPKIEVTVDDGLLSLEVDDAPLSDVLSAIAEQSGLGLRMGGTLNVPVTTAFSDAPLDQGILRLLNRTGLFSSLVMSYESIGEAGDGQILTEVTVYGAGGDPLPAVVSTTASSTRQARNSTAVTEERRLRRDYVQRLRHESLGETVAELRDFAARDEDLVVRRKSIIRLGEMGEAAVNALRSLLTDENHKIRAQALKALSTIRGDEARGALIQSLATEDTKFRLATIKALRKNNHPETVDALARALGHDEDIRVRRSAAAALTSLKSEGARQALEWVANDPDKRIRDIAVATLERWE